MKFSQMEHIAKQWQSDVKQRDKHPFYGWMYAVKQWFIGDFKWDGKALEIDKDEWI